MESNLVGISFPLRRPGRPSNDPVGITKTRDVNLDDPDLHIIMQLRKAVELDGAEDSNVIQFPDHAAEIDIGVAVRALDKYDAAEKPLEKFELIQRFGRSVDDLLEATAR